MADYVVTITASAEQVNCSVAFAPSKFYGTYTGIGSGQPRAASKQATVEALRKLADTLERETA